MAFISFLNTPTTISHGNTATINIQGRNTNYPLALKINTGATGAITGGCTGNISGAVIPAKTYTIPLANQNDYTFTEKLTNECSSLIGKIRCIVNGNSLQITFTTSTDGKPFLNYTAPSSITINAVGVDVPGYTLTYPAKPTGCSYTITRTNSTFGLNDSITPSAGGTMNIFPGDKLTISASPSTGYYYPTYGFGSVGTHTITSVSGNVQAIVNTNGKVKYQITTSPLSGTSITYKEFLYAAHESFDCDGGCYCYCKDGSQVADGEDCPDIYRTISVNTVDYGESFYIDVGNSTGKVFDGVYANGTKISSSTFFNYTVNASYGTATSGPIPLTITTKVQESQWRTIYNSTFTLSGGASSISKYISGLKSSRQTRITVSEGQYQSTSSYTSGGSYVEPSWCDGGCYCYCSDGTEILYDELCYEGGTTYYETNSATISSGTYTSSGTTITLTNNSSVVNGTISISNNNLTFNGYMSTGYNDEKTITITKIEQYY